MTRAQIDRLNVFAWRHGFMVRRQGGKFSVIAAPNLHQMQSDGLSRNDTRVAVKVADRLFTSRDPAELRRWIKTATNTPGETPMKLNYRNDDQTPRGRSGKRFEPVPEDIYLLRTLEIEMRTPKKRQGEQQGADYINIAFEIEAGPHAGRRVWDAFFINHAKPDARGVSRDRLDSLAIACGVALPLDDTDQLLDRVFKAAIEIEEQENFDPKNKVRRYLKPPKSGPLDQPYHREPSTAQPAGQSAERRKRTELDDDIPF